MSEREEIVPRYRSISPPYYRNGRENEEFEQGAQNFEPFIHYVVKQEATTQDIRMFREVELVFVTKQEIVILPRTKPIVAEGVLVVRVRYSEPTFNQ